jgi:hypothetical protein
VVSFFEKSEMPGACRTYGGGERYVGSLVGKHERMRIFGRPEHRWEDNIKINLKEMKWFGVDLIDLAQNKDKWVALLNAVMNIRVPYNASKILVSWGYITLSGTTLLPEVT